VRLYLVQHGQAQSEEEDSERPLTDRGASDVRRVVRQATGAGSVTVERIVHSGKTRARQTAAAWGEALGVPVAEADGLAPLDDPAIWATRVAAQAGDLMLVGHLPHLAKLAGLLLAGDSARPIIDFRQGGLVSPEDGPARWSVWLILPPAAVSSRRQGQALRRPGQLSRARVSSIQASAATAAGKPRVVIASTAA
jgi:phosphohistidine phosphatase